METGEADEEDVVVVAASVSAIARETMNLPKSPLPGDSKEASAEDTKMDDECGTKRRRSRSHPPAASAIPTGKETTETVETVADEDVAVVCPFPFLKDYCNI